MTEEWLRELLPECQDWQIECIVKQWQSDLEKTYRVTDSYEPVAMRYDYDGYGWLYIDNGSGSNWREKIKNAEPLYTAPPQRTWVGLTEEERDHLEGLHLYAARNQVEAWIEGVPAFIDAIEAKLREKNG